jgi:hypothetical protein
MALLTAPADNKTAVAALTENSIKQFRILMFLFSVTQINRPDLSNVIISA